MGFTSQRADLLNSDLMILNARPGHHTIPCDDRGDADISECPIQIENEFRNLGKGKLYRNPSFLEFAILFD